MRTEERRWTMVRTFYRSYQAFHALFEAYERRVEAFVEFYGMDRRDIKLAPDELLSLFDSNALSALRDNELTQLKGAAHQLFRGLDAPDPFDSHVTNIYHEVSLLKEEHWTVLEDVMRADRRAYDRYYREVNVYYPRRLRHVHNLYNRARKRLESVLLPAFSRNKIMVRSVYLFGDRLVRGVYEHGLEELYSFMYPNGGALTGYTLAADSFLDGGFREEAAEAYGMALTILGGRLLSAEDADGTPDRERRELAAQQRNLERRRERALALD
jgi:hypothetical protein